MSNLIKMLAYCRMTDPLDIWA